MSSGPDGRRWTGDRVMTTAVALDTVGRRRLRSPAYRPLIHGVHAPAELTLDHGTPFGRSDYAWVHPRCSWASALRGPWDVDWLIRSTRFMSPSRQECAVRHSSSVIERHSSRPMRTARRSVSRRRRRGPPSIWPAVSEARTISVWVRAWPGWTRCSGVRPRSHSMDGLCWTRQPHRGEYPSHARYSNWFGTGSTR